MSEFFRDKLSLRKLPSSERASSLPPSLHSTRESRSKTSPVHRDHDVHIEASYFESIANTAFERDPTGLRTSDTTVFLTKLVNSFIGHVSERSPASLCLRKARHRSVCGSFLAALAMLTVYMLVSVNRISLLVSSILLFISSLVSVSILSWNVYLRQTELIKGLQAVKDSISFQNMEAVNEASCIPPPSSTFSRCLRDGTWRLIADTSLCPGDVIELCGGARAPADLEPLPSQRNPFLTPLKTDDEFESPNSTRALFYVCSSPLSLYLEKLVFVRSSSAISRPRSALYFQKLILSSVTLRLALFSFSLVLLISILVIIWWGEQDRLKWFALCIEQPMLCALPLLGISTPFFEALVDAFANAVLLLSDRLLRQGHSNERDLLQTCKGSRYQCELFGYVLDVFFGRGSTRNRHVNSFETFGSITAVCALDKDGVLVDVFSTAGHALVVENGTPLVLDVIQDANTPTGIVFERDLHDHLPSMRPLALACSISATCNASRSDGFEYGLPAHGLPKVEAAEREQELSLECLCCVGREIGFDTGKQSDYERLQLLHIMQEQQPQQGSDGLVHLTSVVVRNASSPLLQLFSRGDPDLVLSRSAHVWNGQQAVSLSPSVRDRVLEIWRRWKHEDLKCVAFSYAPVSPKRTSLFNSASRRPSIVAESSVHAASNHASPIDPYAEVQDQQVLLGLMSMRQLPKPDVPLLVDDLTHAGIRFVMFSALDRRRSVALAARIGLETDWNFYISLRDPDPHTLTQSTLDVAPNISKLPEGISCIRPHLEKVDNVPLLVSLFTDSKAWSVQEMIRILQENGDTVLTLGSSFNDTNTLTFLQSDIALSIRPLPSTDHSFLFSPNERQSAHIQSTFRLAEAVTSLPCAFSLPHTVSVRSYISGMIGQGRRLLLNAKLSFMFALCCFASTSLLNTVSVLLGCPPPFLCHHILWLVWLVIPALSVSLMFTMADPDLMQCIAEKNLNHLPSIRRFFFYFMIRFVPTTLLCIGYFIVWVMTLMMTIISSISVTMMYRNLRRNTQESGWIFYYYNRLPRTGMEMDSPRVHAELVMARSFTLFAFVYSICWLSMGFLHRTASLKLRSPFRNRIWLFTVVLVLLAQLGFSIALVLGAEFTVLQDTFRPVELSFLLVAWPIFLVIFDEIAKRHDRKAYRRRQQRLRIVFNTKLGMHSPK